MLPIIKAMDKDRRTYNQRMKDIKVYCKKKEEDLENAQ